MEMFVTVFVYMLFTGGRFDTTAATPSIQRHLVDGQRESASSVLVASDTNHWSDHPAVDDDDDTSNCGRQLQHQMIDCLEGFEVQLVVYGNPQLDEDQRWEELRKLCRLHDQTLQCIYLAFMRCQPTELDLQFMAYRIGHLRDYLLKECRLVRGSTTSTTPAPSIAPHAPQQPSDTQAHRERQASASSDNDQNFKVKMAKGPAYALNNVTVSASRPSDGHRRQQGVLDGSRRADNDTHSRLSEDLAGHDLGILICRQVDDGRTMTECLLKAYSNSAASGSSLCRDLVVCCLLVVCLLFWRSFLG